MNLDASAQAAVAGLLRSDLRGPGITRVPGQGVSVT
jgi:hypothetical protein